MKALFLTADLGGNVPPTLAVAGALARRGAEVEVAGLADGVTALPQVPFPPATAIAASGDGTVSREPAIRLFAGDDTSRLAADLVVRRAADVVVVDGMTLAPMRGALDTGVPVVCLFHTISDYWVHSFDTGGFRAMLRAHDLRPLPLWRRCAVRLLLTDRELDQGPGSAVVDGAVWTGPAETGLPPTPRSGRPRVLVTLSTTPLPGMLEVYRRIVAALADLEVHGVVTTGRIPLGGVLEPAPNAEVRGWASHADLLPGVDLVVGHGGHSTTMKALAHGVPLLILPLNLDADQERIGELVEAAGVGIALPASSSSEAIRGAVQRLLEDDGIRARAAATGERLRAARPGAEVAADRILDAVR